MNTTSTTSKKSSTKAAAPKPEAPPVEPSAQYNPNSVRPYGMTPETKELVAAVMADPETVLALLDGYGGDDQPGTFVSGALTNIAYELAALSQVAHGDVSEATAVAVPYLIQKRTEAVRAVHHAIIRSRSKAVQS